MGYKIYDAHAHIFPAKIAEKATQSIGHFYDIPMHHLGSAEELLRRGGEIGISRYLVCSTATKPEQVEHINTFIHEQCELHPEFYGFATMHPDYAHIEEELDRALEMGLHGIKLHPDFQHFDIDAPEALPLYRELIAREQAGKLDFSRVRSANLDEYKGLAPDHPQSYRRFMQENLFDHISIKPENTIVPDGLADDIPSMCRAYERKIEDWGGVDIQLLGIGHDGHIGFNEPCDHFPVMTHEVKLTDMTREANKRFFTSINEVPTAAITMGIGTVMAAKKIVMIITGADKAEILHKVFFSPVTPEVPGSILQFHHDVTLICDEAAAARMPQ